MATTGIRSEVNYQHIRDALQDAGVQNSVQAEIAKARDGSTVIVVPGHDDEIRVSARDFARQLDRAEAGYVPYPDHRAARGGDPFVYDGDQALETRDGYRVEFEKNEIRIFSPVSGDDPVTTINGRQVSESDGTQWTAGDGNFFLPNGVLLRPQYTGDGEIRSVELVHGNTVARVDGMRGDDDIRIRSASGLGVEHRRRLIEDHYGEPSYHLGGTHDAEDEENVTWHMGRWANETLREIEDGYDEIEGDYKLGNRRYYVDPEIEPDFGTPEYERMLRTQVNDTAASLSGARMANGARRDAARLATDYQLGLDGTYEAYAREIAASAGIDYDSQRGRTHLLDALSRIHQGHQTPGTAGLDQRKLIEFMMMQRLFGGLRGTSSGGFNDSLASLAALRQLLASRGTASNDLAASLAPALSYISSVGAHQDHSGMRGAAQAAVIAKAVETVSRDGTLRRFPSRAGAIHHDPFAERLRYQYASERSAGRPDDRKPSGGKKPERLDVNNDWAEGKAKKLTDITTNWWNFMPWNDDESNAAEKLMGFASDERIAVLEKISDENLSEWMDALPNDDDGVAGKLMATLVKDAEKYPERASKQLERVVDGVDKDLWEDDDEVRAMIEELGGHEEAVKHLKHVKPEVLKKMSDICKVDDFFDMAFSNDEVGTLEQARTESEGKKLSPAAREALALARAPDDPIDLYQRDRVDKATDAAGKLLVLPASERIATLKLLSDEEMTRFGDDISDKPDKAGALVAQLVKDSGSNRDAEVTLRRLLKGIGEDWFEGDDAMRSMLKSLGGTQTALPYFRKLDAESLKAMRDLVEDEEDSEVFKAIDSAMSKKK